MQRKDNGNLLHKQIAFKAENVKEDGTFTGYGSIFGNVDSYREIVAPGAFKSSIARIKENSEVLPVLWQHNPDQPIGGYTEVSEDDRGLKMAGFLLKDDVALAREAYALMKARVVKGLSIGYYVPKGGDSYDEKTGIRTLHEVDLRETSVVTFPANEQAQVENVKNALRFMLNAGQLPSVKQFEDFLREAGFSKSHAAAIAVHGMSKLHRGEPDSTKGVVELLSNFKLTS